MPKTPDSAPPTDSGLAFEDALAQLESLVREMESDEIPLDDLIQNFEKGNQLFGVCEKRLDEAEGRIEIIRKKRNGDEVLESFDAELPGEEASEDHGELF